MEQIHCAILLSYDEWALILCLTALLLLLSSCMKLYWSSNYWAAVWCHTSLQPLCAILLFLWLLISYMVPYCSAVITKQLYCAILWLQAALWVHTWYFSTMKTEQHWGFKILYCDYWAAAWYLTALLWLVSCCMVPYLYMVTTEHSYGTILLYFDY